MTSSNPVIAVHDLSKCYRIYDQPKDRLKQAVWRHRKQYYKEFWALRDISFDLNRGESLGVIGRNGSGKSTLLQTICGTLTPTTGKVSIKGKLAALLELGSGFNPDFTGIENIYLNASLLGLSQKQIEAKLDDILAFADIGDFVYQPVKTYSSGMVVRLAFAVMANSEPDILIVDEALAVGDAYFTQKCMRFINRFRDHGCLLFVSHDSAAVNTVCNKAILLKEGQIVASGNPRKVTEAYTRETYQRIDHEITSLDLAPSEQPETAPSRLDTDDDWFDYRSQLINSSQQANILSISRFDESHLQAESFGTGKATIINVRLLEALSNRPLMTGVGGERVILSIDAVANEDISEPIVGFLLKNEKGLVLLGDNTLNSLHNLQAPVPIPIAGKDTFNAQFEFTIPLLPYGKYSFTVSLAEGNQAVHTQLQWMNDALIFECLNTSIAAGLAGVPMHRIDLRTLD